MANTAAKFGTRKRAGGINITPFVDVLLVVLVIFILTSNASIPGIQVNLPKASATVALEKPQTKAITIDDRGQIFLDAYPMTLPELEERLRAQVEHLTPRDAANQEKCLTFSCDQSATFPNDRRQNRRIRPAPVRSVAMSAPNLRRSR